MYYTRTKCMSSISYDFFCHYYNNNHTPFIITLHRISSGKRYGVLLYKTLNSHILFERNLEQIKPREETLRVHKDLK